VYDKDSGLINDFIMNKIIDTIKIF